MAINEGQWDREADDIDRREAEGLIDAQQAAAERRQLQRDYRAEAQESAERAYDEEMERW